ncbi:MAG: tRNA lysidine(34) synthetase TilS [Kiritimatiellae bacterium]|nr:tRNA lysidine(34) synthetase TilS [Kiritimatiellia bacterium]
MDGTVHAFRKILEGQSLLQGVNRLGLAVSGGADSVALFRLFAALAAERPLELTLLHVNHGLRDASEEEEGFVRALAERFGVPFRLHRANLRETPLPPGSSMEMAAREVRLAFYRQAYDEEGLDAIATGHHADDRIETFLLRLSRGAGTEGLTGLKPDTVCDGIRIIRPLLTFAPADLRAYLTAIGQPWREDTTNREESIPRNKIRHTVIPYLERAWDPALRRHLLQTVEILSEEDACLAAMAADRLRDLQTDQGNALRWRELIQQPLALQRRVLRGWFFAIGQNPATTYERIHALLDTLHRLAGAVMGIRRFPLSVTHDLILTDNAMRVEPAQEKATPPPPVPLQIPGETRWGAWRFTVTPATGWRAESCGIGQSPATFTLSAAACAGKPLILRARQPGDRIAPTGMTGSRKIKDLLIDAKIPESDRDAIPILACGDTCIYLPGYRIARAFAVPSPTSPAFLCRVTRREIVR